eukprot:GHVT01071827.1.p2 GENE.GHVT01071827.1~~GHVT01071827.1.p2  ORF type:complete len:122 (+),score=3.99 GHVT01071827.1:1354-1719(+)
MNLHKVIQGIRDGFPQMVIEDYLWRVREINARGQEIRQECQKEIVAMIGISAPLDPAPDREGRVVLRLKNIGSVLRSFNEIIQAFILSEHRVTLPLKDRIIRRKERHVVELLKERSLPRLS